MWSGLEINVAIICGSAPALSAFMNRVILRKNSSSDGQYANSSTTWRERREGPGGAAEGNLEEGGMRITVQYDVEMKTFTTDDTGSEREMIVAEAFSPALKSLASGTANVNNA